MEANEQLIPVNPYTRPGTKRSFTRNIVWHWTANPGATAENHVGYFGETIPEANRLILEKVRLGELTQEQADKMMVYASAHVFIDRIQTLIIIPLDELAYHASQANPYSIGVELCVEEDGSFHPETVRRAIEFGAYLAKEYNLNTLSDFLRHYDVTGKICPKPWVDHPSDWDSFKQSVSDMMQNKGGSRILELKEDWQWTMLGDALTELSKVGGGPDGTTQLLSYEWAEKAYKRELTVDEAAWLMIVAFARSLGREVEAR